MAHAQSHCRLARALPAASRLDGARRASISLDQSGNLLALVASWMWAAAPAPSFPDLTKNTSGSVFTDWISSSNRFCLPASIPARFDRRSAPMRFTCPTAPAVFDIHHLPFLAAVAARPIAAGLEEMVRVTQPGGYVCALRLNRITAGASIIPQSSSA
jgi:hypothetical protein